MRNGCRILALLCLALAFRPAELDAQTYNISPVPKLQFLDTSGNPYASAKLCTYTTGTSTPLATYSDNAGTPNSNPVTLDSAGRGTVFLANLSTYRFVLKTGGTPGSCADGTTVFTQDSISAAAPTTISGTAGCVAKFNTTGNNLSDSIACEAAGTITVTGNLTVTGTLSAPRTRRIPDVVQDVVVSSGSPTTVIIGTAVTGVAISSSTASGVSTGFKVPVDAVATQPLTLALGYSVDGAPGVTNNKVKLTVGCTVNGTAAATTAGDTITLANNTTPASYTGTLNLCAASSFAAGDDVVVTIARDVTVTNNAIVNFYIRRIGFIYTSAQGLAILPKTWLEWLLVILMGAALYRLGSTRPRTSKRERLRTPAR